MNPGQAVSVAVVGLGVRGRQWAEVFSLVPAAKLAAVIDTAAVTGVPGVPSFRSLNEAARAVHLDAVVIATPPAVHRSILETAVSHHFAVLCEKPLSETLAEAIEMVRLASAKNVPLLVGMNFRFLPVVAEARRRVRSADLGRPIYATFTYLRNRASRRSDLNSYPATMEHPMLLEQSIHHLDLIRYVYSREALNVSAHSWNPPTSTYRGDACVAMHLEMAGGLHVEYVGTWVAGTNRMDFRWRTDFERGVMIQERQFSDLAVAKRVSGADLTGPRFDEEGEPPLSVSLPASKPFVDDTAGLLAALCATSTGEESEATSGTDHLKTLALVHASIASAATCRTVSVPVFAAKHGIDA